MIKTALFIRTHSSSRLKEGGEMLTERNLRFLKGFLGNENVEEYAVGSKALKRKTNFFKRAFLIFKGYNTLLNPEIVKEVLNIAQDKDLVFIDRSIYGIIAKKLREFGYKGQIITHFHNVESMFLKTRLSPCLPTKPFLIHCMLKNDMCALQYSDKSIVLNHRDKDLLYYFFEIMPTNIIPITLVDENPTERTKKSLSTPLRCVFLGANNSTNVKGVKWFVKKVLPHVDIKLQIIGKGLEFLRKKRIFKHIDILANITDISDLIKEADCIIMPIFENSGMKVTTCFALMYGKNILATTDAFEGYSIDFQKVGSLCNNATDFIIAIQNFDKNFHKKHNEYSRNLFLEQYNDAKAEILFRELFV